MCSPLEEQSTVNFDQNPNYLFVIARLHLVLQFQASRDYSALCALHTEYTYSFHSSFSPHYLSQELQRQETCSEAQLGTSAATHRVCLSGLLRCHDRPGRILHEGRGVSLHIRSDDRLSLLGLHALPVLVHDRLRLGLVPAPGALETSQVRQ
jgi:hypothetical protein